MGKKKVTDTRHGKHAKRQVVRDSGIFSTKYYVRKDGKPEAGSFKSRADAVRWAEEKNRK